MTQSTSVSSNPSTPRSAGSASLHKRSPLAELVNTPRITRDKRTKTGSARVLTSTECIRVFEEKEEQKRLALEEKQKRKEEREKKKQKEQELLRKKEEKERKAATKEVKRREKDAMQASKQQHKQAQSSKRAAASLATSQAKKSRTAENADDEIDSN